MIYGQKTRLRRIEREDIPTFVRWFSDPQVREFLKLNRPISKAEEEKWFERQLDRQDSELFAIETMDGTHIGNIGLDSIDWVHRQAELGIVIGEQEYWSQGYGSDAIRTLLRFAFQEMNLHRVSLRVYQDNARGIRAYEKCGFRHEGCLREAIYRQGRYYDTLIMGILSHEFEPPQEADGQTISHAG
jgi:UDP-4-amino-4,6-dideoxy-N-acetyl-beta-L-altrosamine N-acetyltransferase